MSDEKKTSTVLKKDRTVNVKTKTGGNYSYSYSTLAEIHRYLEETGQGYEAYIKKVEGDDYMFIRKLSKNGKAPTELQCAKIPPVTGVQDYGGVLTSVRRFSLLMAYGLACEENAAQKAPPSTDAAAQKWKKMRTPDANKPATARQLTTIRQLCEERKINSQSTLEYLQRATNQEEASRIIKSLIETKNKE